MKLNREEILQWLMDNVQEYANSLDAAQQQTVQSWDDTYKKWKEIIDTYWEDVDEILSDKTKFLDFMREGLDYMTASAAEATAMLMDLTDAYEKWIKSTYDNASYLHDDNGGHGEYSGSNQGSGGPGGGGGKTSADKKAETSGIKSATTAQAKGGLLGLLGGATQSEAQLFDNKKQQVAVLSDDKKEKDVIQEGFYVDWNGKRYGSYATIKEANRKLIELRNNKKDSLVMVYRGKPYFLSEYKAMERAGQEVAKMGEVKQYSKGGELDYTGIAQVHGTKQNPEAVLNAKQTKEYKWMMDNVPEYIKKQAMKEQQEYAEKKKSIAEIRARVNNGAEFAVQLSDEDKALLRSLNGNMTNEERSNISRQVNANIRARIAEQNKTLAEEIKQFETSMMVPLSEFTTSFTSADRDVIRKYMEASAYTMLTPAMSNIDSETMNSSSSVRSIGNVTITINQADLSTDERIEDVAQKIGDAFVRQLSRTGMQVTDFQM
jgi:hypothetical protein